MTFRDWIIKKVALLTVIIGFAGCFVLAQKPLVRIGVALDGPSQMNQQSLEVFEAEIRDLLEGEFDIQFPAEKRLEGNWTAAGVKTILDSLLNDPDVDQVLALGILSSHDAGHRNSLSKPVYAPFVVDPVMQRIPFEILEIGEPGDTETVNVSGVRNLSYLLLGGAVTRDIEAFRDLVSFDKLTVLGVNAWRQMSVDLEAEIGSVLTGPNLRQIEVIEVGTSAQETLNQLSADADIEAVYISPLPNLSPGEFEKLSEGLIELALPSFSFRGRDEVEKGILASLGVVNVQRRARRVALNIQEVLAGGNPGELSIDYRREERLTVNMATAKAIGISPKYTTLLKADVLNDRPSSAVRTISLPVVVREASAVNLDLAASARGVAAEKELVRQARSALLPQVGVSGSASFIDDDLANFSLGVGAQQYAASLGASQLIYSDRVWANYGIQKNLLNVRREEQAELRLDVILEAAESYLNVLRAETVRQVYQNNLQLTQTNLDLARSRVEIGVAGREEIFRWESQIANDQKAVVDTEALYGLARIAVNRVLNRPLTEDFTTVEVNLSDPELVSSFESLRPYIESPGAFGLFSDFMVEEAVAGSPELRQLDSQIKALSREVEAGWRSFYLPDFSLAGGLGGLWNKGEGSDIPAIFPDFPTWTWNVRVDATLPLFTSGDRQGKLNRAKEQLEEARLQREAIWQRIEQGLRSGLEETQASFLGMDLTRQAADAARQNLNLVTESYAAGVVDILRLLDAQSQALIADLSAANAVFDYMLNVMSVQRSVGQFDYYRSAQERLEFLQRLDLFVAQAGFKVRRP